MVWFTNAGGATNALAFRFRQSVATGSLSEIENRVRVITPIPPRREDASEKTFDGELHALASAYADALIERHGFDEQPFVIIGHSFGTVIAYEVTRRLLVRDRYAHRLVVMSFPAPDRQTHQTQLHSLDDAALITQVDELFAGVPADIQATRMR